jgi:hypothetical protein
MAREDKTRPDTGVFDKEPAEGSREVIDRELKRQGRDREAGGGPSPEAGGEKPEAGRLGGQDRGGQDRGGQDRGGRDGGKEVGAESVMDATKGLP